MSSIVQYETQPVKMYLQIRRKKIHRLYLTERDIYANPDKCEAVINMGAPMTKKEVIKLNRMLASLDRFISRSTQLTLLIYKLLKK